MHEAGRITGNPEVMNISSTSDTLGEERKLKSGRYNRVVQFSMPALTSPDISLILSVIFMFCFSYPQYLPRCEFAFRRLHNQELNIKGIMFWRT